MRFFQGGLAQGSEKKRFVSKRWAAKELGSEEADKLSKAQRKGRASRASWPVLLVEL